MNGGEKKREERKEGRKKEKKKRRRRERKKERKKKTKEEEARESRTASHLRIVIQHAGPNTGDDVVGLIGGCSRGHEVSHALDVALRCLMGTTARAWWWAGGKLGAFFGTFFGGALMLRYGRRRAIAATCIATVCGPLIMSLSLGPSGLTDDFGLIIGRLVGGFGIGASATVTPAYLAEVAPPNHRGAMVLTYELMLCGGMLAAGLVDVYVTMQNPIMLDPIMQDMLCGGMLAAGLVDVNVMVQVMLCGGMLPAGLVDVNVMVQVMLCGGMLAAGLVDVILQGTVGGWRWMVGLPALPASLLALSLVLLPESPSSAGVPGSVLPEGGA
eukprot:gene18279-24735_t